MVLTDSAITVTMGFSSDLPTNYGWFNTCEFPSPVAASPKGMHTRLLKSQSCQSQSTQRGRDGSRPSAPRCA